MTLPQPPCPRESPSYTPAPTYLWEQQVPWAEIRHLLTTHDVADAVAPLDQAVDAWAARLEELEWGRSVLEDVALASCIGAY